MLPADAEVRQVIDELDAWNGPGFVRAQVALDRLHPEQSRFVFENLQSSTGVLAVLAVRTLLTRLDALERAPEREATREADQAALATLATRGIGSDERRRLWGLVETAERGTQETAVTSAVQAMAELSREQRQADLRDLRAWYVDWAETARSLLRRRDDRIHLGLARRRNSRVEETPDEGGPNAGTPRAGASCKGTPDAGTQTVAKQPADHPVA